MSAPVRSLLVLHRPENFPALQDELARTEPGGAIRPLAPDVALVTRASPTARPRLAFARQLLPEPRAVDGASIGAIADGVLAALVEAEARIPGEWRLQALAIPGGPVKAGRASLIADALVERLHKRRRALLRRMLKVNEHFTESETAIQLLLLDPAHAWLSIAPPSLRATLGPGLSKAPLGTIEIARDHRPPSRAYQKLLEAEQRLGARILAGEQVVDLGASPGGWSHVALSRAARVTAVDRAPLREDLMADTRLTFVKGDAFAFTPMEPVDWLVCDVIAFPQRSLELLEKWLSRGLCRRFVVSVKFRGTEDYALLDAVWGVLARHAPAGFVRQLDANKNEVTALGSIGGAAA